MFEKFYAVNKAASKVGMVYSGSVKKTPAFTAKYSQ